MKVNENNRSRDKEAGFSLLEILIAMIVLAVGGVSILSLFAAAVTLQYDSVVGKKQAEVLSDVVAEAQIRLDQHSPTSANPVPDSVERKPVPRAPNEFAYEIRYAVLDQFPPGEGARATIRIYYLDNPLDEVVRVLQKRDFTKKELEESISLEQDRKADAEAEEAKEEREK